MGPTRRDGALWYPRNDTPTDDDGHRTEIEPMTGNVLLGYARLDVADGLHELYQHPWGPEHFAEPALTEVGRDVEVSRAEVVDGVLHARLRRRGLSRGGDDGSVLLGRVPDGARLRLDGQEVALPEGLRLDVPAGSAHDLELVP
jgi:hypothetical protein